MVTVGEWATTLAQLGKREGKMVTVGRLRSLGAEEARLEKGKGEKKGPF